MLPVVARIAPFCVRWHVPAAQRDSVDRTSSGAVGARECLLLTLWGLGRGLLAKRGQEQLYESACKKNAATRGMTNTIQRSHAHNLLCAHATFQSKGFAHTHARPAARWHCPAKTPASCSWRRVCCGGGVAQAKPCSMPRQHRASHHRASHNPSSVS